MWPRRSSKVFKKGFSSSHNLVADCPGCAESTVQSPPFKSSDDTFKYKLFVSTWNVGGVEPPDDLNMEDLLDTSSSYCDIYVLGFQEIIPLRGSNVLGLERRRVCMKWNSLVGEALNKEEREEEEVPWGYDCIIIRQMVGLFVTVWVRSHIRHHIRHLGVSCVGCGFLGYLGNKGSIAIRFQLHETSFCFVCSHLASGGRQDDKRHRNDDVSEIFSRTSFPTTSADDHLPKNILDHEYVPILL
ncbi:hypothetical protein Nepgr_016977 [Nepenthes gracilis]|uniref:Inositol polyphosphate-related phosphatase domain-containing protein n=1 Tax=Nepenthes gracilis TaxID=150966 RepID=A0AAD3XSV4_NEPGR|nr:hypothetical protein Nepgr_016977 [Nepenthes gracilis]